MGLTRDQILEAADLVIEPVPVPEWGGDVGVRVMSAADRDAFEASMIEVGEDGRRRPHLVNMRAKLVAAAACDDAGNRIFADEDVLLLARKSSAALNRVYEAAARLNGLGNRSVEDAAKN